MPADRSISRFSNQGTPHQILYFMLRKEIAPYQVGHNNIIQSSIVGNYSEATMNMSSLVVAQYYNPVLLVAQY